ncbi:transmembrane protein 86a [Plakobranchus ocellatus]|uniref:lysoplasmalogenase n=1 Tax=Plakobranchus ocellatus TaxID=259542 RepID=A0AAV4CFH5_9GAST|nr:transmembrane protein 86a [Plakobranchus ocellatus]
MDPALIPFFLLLLLYLVTFSPHLGRAPEVWSAVLLKILPVWYLAAYVVLKGIRTKSSPNVGNEISAKKANNYKDAKCQENGVQTSEIGKNSTSHLNRRKKWRFHDHVNDISITSSSASKYDALPLAGLSKMKNLDNSDETLPKILFLSGLLISSIGDACLVYKALFKLGILAFGAAQFMYLLAFKHWHRKSRVAWVAVPLCITLNLILAPGIDEIVLNFLVLGYSLLIHSMLFYAIAGFESFPSQKSLATMIGACLFIASDFLIALNKWVTNTPYAEASILLTYYTAQLLLTVGIC